MPIKVAHNAYSDARIQQLYDALGVVHNWLSDSDEIIQPDTTIEQYLTYKSPVFDMLHKLLYDQHGAPTYGPLKDNHYGQRS